MTDGDSILVIAQLIDPKGNIRVFQEKLINNETISPYFTDPRDGLKRKFYHGEFTHTFALTAGYLEAGLWRVRVFKSNSSLNKV